MSEDIRRHNSEQLTLHGEKLEELGLQMCVAQIERTKYAMSDPKGTNNKIASALTELGNRLMDECELFHFISLSSEDSKYYEPKNSLLGQNVDDKIPGVVEDVSEAGKCLGLHRSTAAVFHLMRVMESGVQAFGAKLGIDLVSEKVWQVILDQVNSAIRALGKDPLAKQYASVSAHLYTVKLAWRNEVMHPKATYTHEEAEGIFRAVRSFMNDLVTLL